MEPPFFLFLFSLSDFFSFYSVFLVTIRCQFPFGILFLDSGAIPVYEAVYIYVTWMGLTLISYLHVFIGNYSVE